IASLKKSRYSSLMAQIILAKEIAIAYESNYGFFKANSRFKVEKKPIIGRFERLQYISSATLQYVAVHPEQLAVVCSNSGIRVRGRVYQPQKTLFMKNECAYDTYENRVILSFLRKMIDEVAKLREKVNNFCITFLATKIIVMIISILRILCLQRQKNHSKTGLANFLNCKNDSINSGAYTGTSLRFS
ncbi:MAG: DUF2357 domain-containing protein, partial [Lachnospiraceae bacterium]|nr:DUF2357 domain-containing protein [Lachnospiraceae bacterium]